MSYNESYYHNEIELVRVDSAELKNKIEKAFLRNRISYFIRWDKGSFFQRMFGKKNKEQCKICINDWDKEKALDILKDFEKDIENQGEMLSGRTESSLKGAYVHKQLLFI